MIIVEGSQLCDGSLYQYDDVYHARQPRSAPMAQTAAERLGSPRLAPAEAEGSGT